MKISRRTKKVGLIDCAVPGFVGFKIVAKVKVSKVVEIIFFFIFLNIMVATSVFFFCDNPMAFWTFYFSLWCMMSFLWI